MMSQLLVSVRQRHIHDAHELGLLDCAVGELVDLCKVLMTTLRSHWQDETASRSKLINQRLWYRVRCCSHMYSVIGRALWIAQATIARHELHVAALQELRIRLLDVGQRLVHELLDVLDADGLARLAHHDGHAGCQVARARADVQSRRALSQLVLERLERKGVHVRRRNGHAIAYALRTVRVGAVS